jgi:hypothetical protein
VTTALDQQGIQRVNCFYQRFEPRTNEVPNRSRFQTGYGIFAVTSGTEPEEMYLWRDLLNLTNDTRKISRDVTDYDLGTSMSFAKVRCLFETIPRSAY